VQDAIAGFQSAPLWAQIAMGFFACTFLVMLVEPWVSHRRYRRQFDDIVRGLGQQPPRGGSWPFTARTTLGERQFEITYDLRRSGRGSSYRGPRGRLLITTTRLANPKWSMHQIDISRVEGLLSRLASRRRATGDPSFDGRFMVVEDGLPVRDGWLDAEMRTAIARFFDEARLPGVIWIREGELQFLMQDPWTGIDAPAIRALLEHQAALATALARTAFTGRP
jgi:hypothetical protein